jgi:hypothetical protein
MSPRLAGPFAALSLAAMVLAGCASETDLRSQTLAYQKAYCASKGKQFLWQDTKTDEGVFQRSVTAEGHCVGPGDPGYEAPSTDAQP